MVRDNGSEVEMKENYSRPPACVCPLNGTAHKVCLKDNGESQSSSSSNADKTDKMKRQSPHFAQQRYKPGSRKGVKPKKRYQC